MVVNKVANMVAKVVVDKVAAEVADRCILKHRHGGGLMLILLSGFQ